MAQRVAQFSAYHGFFPFSCQHHMPVKRIITGLSRFDFDDKGEHGYLVALSRSGVKHWQRFSDGVHGGKRESLKAARAWHQNIIDTYPAYTRQQYASITRRNNTSGHPGVSAVKGVDGNIISWAALWLTPGSDRYQRRKFSVREFGSARAKELAIMARERGLSALTEEPWTGGGNSGSPEVSARRKARYAAAHAARANDWRIARVRTSRTSVTLQLFCGVALQLPLEHYPALKKASTAARSRWNADGYSVTWLDLKLTIDARAFLNPALLRIA